MAEVATPSQMEQVCRNWLSYIVHHKGGWAGETEPGIVGVEDVTAGELVLARCFSIAPRGYVVVPVLMDLPPIKAYSDEHGLDVNRSVGLPQLLREILEHRVNLFIARYGDVKARPLRSGEVLFDPINRLEWDGLLVPEEQFQANLRLGLRDTFEEHGPLLTTVWHQGAPYNNSCPLGQDDERVVVGCVATAAAQLLRYHEWPPNGVGSHAYYWSGDDSCGGSTPGQTLSADFSDAYDWGNMPDDCSSGCSTTEEDALAELCHEVGVAYEMDYGVCGSGTQTQLAGSILPTHFRYGPAIDVQNRFDYSAGEWFDIIQDEINANRPMLYTITSHAIVCDGWRDTGGEDQYHMNYGWGGGATAWYAIDNLHCDWPGCDPMAEYLIRDIAPLADADCNGNAIPDHEDIWSGTSPDCNRNSVPDECDVSAGTSADCQPDGGADECQITQVVSPSTETPCSPTATNGDPWCEDFESYAEGSIQGLNGWQGWGAGTGDPEAAGNVTTEQNHTIGGSKSLEIEAHDTVHVFEGYNLATSSCWVLRARVYIPSTMSGLAYFIVNPDYNGGEGGTTWAVTVDMTAAGGLIHGQDARASLPLIMDDWAEIRAEINFAHDLVTIYYDDVVLGAHPWSMGGGSTTISAVDLFSSDSSGFYYDDLSLFPAASVDCNGNEVPDDCDLVDGTSADCNGNAVPDECDIAAGTSNDCTSNGIPDECEPDCNGNGFADSCDLNAGTSYDCQPNGVPDECEVPPIAPEAPDCNGNGAPDECEGDCQPNGIPDDCDLSAGTSADCNENDDPDECDIAGGTSADVNGNEVPDECDTGAPLPAPYPHNRRRNRYLAFNPNKTANDGLDTAFKVKLISLTLGSCSNNGAPCRTDDDCRACSATGTPCISAPIDCEPDPPGQTCDLTGATCVNDHADSIGRTWWVGPEHPTLANDVHLLVSEVGRKVSTDWPVVVYVADCEIVPVATYGLRATLVGSGPPERESDELRVSTIDKPDGWWADCVGQLALYCTGNWAACTVDGDCPFGETCLEQWPPPDGFINFHDVTAAMFTFSGLPAVTTTGISNVDLHGNEGGDAGVDPPNYVVNFADIANIVGAFQGRPYPYSDPGDCPENGAWP